MPRDFRASSSFGYSKTFTIHKFKDRAITLCAEFRLNFIYWNFRLFPIQHFFQIFFCFKQSINEQSIKWNKNAKILFSTPPRRFIYESFSETWTIFREAFSTTNNNFRWNKKTKTNSNILTICDQLIVFRFYGKTFFLFIFFRFICRRGLFFNGRISSHWWTTRSSNRLLILPYEAE